MLHIFNVRKKVFVSSTSQEEKNRDRNELLRLKAALLDAIEKEDWYLAGNYIVRIHRLVSHVSDIIQEKNYWDK